jgi:hypothetical protein
MNKKTDNMDMDNAYMRAEQKRQETERHATRLKEFLIYGADIPEDIQKQYGFSEDYRLYKELEEMDGRQYSEKRQQGEVPDAGKVGGRLTRAVEKAYESICGSPSRVYIEGLYKELLLLGGMTVRKDYDDPVHYNPGFFDKYGITKKTTVTSKKRKSMDIQITKSQLRLLCGGLIGLASLVMQACDMEQDKDVRESICGNWESVESKPDLLIYKEGNAYKVTVFKRSGISRKLKPETYLLQMEDNGNLFMNTGFRIDVAYNEETDILTFSPNGDYIRATPAADNAEDRQ